MNTKEICQKDVKMFTEDQHKIKMKKMFTENEHSRKMKNVYRRK